MDSLALDLRAALRALRKRPAFATVAILTLALGIGANTALFSVVHAVLLRPLPFQEPERLVRVTNRVVGSDFELTPAADYLDWRDQSEQLAGITAFADGAEQTLRHGETSERLRGARVSASFFPVLGLRLAQGRGFLPTEEKLQGGRVAVVSHRLWNRLFGSETRLSGQMIRPTSRRREIAVRAARSGAASSACCSPRAPCWRFSGAPVGCSSPTGPSSPWWL